MTSHHEELQVFSLGDNTDETLKDPYHGKMKIAENCPSTSLVQSLEKSTADSGEHGGVIVTGDRLHSAFSFPVLKGSVKFEPK